MKLKYYIFSLLFLLLQIPFVGRAQNDAVVIDKTLSYNEFIGMVKKYHPIAKQANLKVSMAQADLLKARGAFDPKIEVDFDNKEFKGKEYYNLLNGGLKIPTWYGVELKAAFDRNEGIYVNPQNTVPVDGLGSIGLSVPIGRDLWINKRMADLKKAKLNVAMSVSEKRLLATEVIYNASIAYFEWLKSYQKYKLYDQYWYNAKSRLDGVKQLVQSGDKPAIDSIESGMVLKKRTYERNKMQLKLIKSQLGLSNYLWTQDAIPLEVSESLLPEVTIHTSINSLLLQEGLLVNEYEVKKHPKMELFDNKLKLLTIDKQWKANQLLPELNVGYYYLSEPDLVTQTNFDNYKIGLNFSYNLFLRKERASYKLSKYKIQNVEYEQSLTKLQLINKLKYQQSEIENLGQQIKTLSDLVTDFEYMLRSEEKLFRIGESSIFYINTREEKLLKAKINQIDLQNEYCKSNATMIKLQANTQ